jgi:cytochrome c553
MTRFLAAVVIFGALLAGPASAREQGAGPGADQDSDLGAPATQPLDETERAALSPSRGMLELGRGVADKACAECHGMDGASREPGQPHLAGQRTAYLHRVIKAYQARERRNDDMYHATGFLNDEALLAVSAYYASLAPVLAPAADDTVEAGIAEPEGAGDPFADIRGAMKKCVKCHGEDGNAAGSGMPNLTAQDPEYFLSSMQAYADGARSHNLMRKMVANLDEQTLSGMAVFYAVQEPLRKDKAGAGDAKKGAALAESCATCHGADGNAGNADMPTLAGQDARYFAKAMKAYQAGARQHEKMFEAVEKLSETEIADLAAFYAAQQPVRRNVRTPLTTSEWIVRCERCHGIDGNSTDPRFPMLAGQDETYLAQALQAYAGNTRSNSVMHAMADPLSATDMARLARHYATRTPKSVVYMQLPCEEPKE